MSIPPVPNHPPRPGRRKPAEETPDSITTQLFIGQDRPADADGSTQALSAEEIQRLRSMVSADGTEATEVLSLDELRQLAAEGAGSGGPESEESGPSPRKASASDIAEAQAASAPRQWNPQGTPHNGGAEGPGRGGEGFGAAAPGMAAASGAAAAPGRAGYGSQGQGGGTPVPPAGAGYAAGYGGDGYGPGGPTGPGGGAGGGSGPGGPYRREPETKRVPAWLWVLAAIALVLALGIVGYIVWDSMQSRDDVASAPVSPSPAPSLEPTEGPETSSPPAAVETFASPSGNIECTIDSERARCVISSFDYTPPERPEDCQMENWGSVVVANGEGAGFSCVEAPENAGPARVLGYGESISASGMTCTSAEDGMTCTSDSTGVGFTVRRASVDFLGD
ncbi:DUF6636 domain-containing protein [Brevibacterium casei]|uniref:Uncharacterized protein n=1 Tax=Brevibacterium casei CIP 102111 TaxID=1255625 RepID=A0A2H1I621_9MICO|nr:DUF6636 domain-containing protein [Brevibacterium casei]QPR40685.1 hypothetical protein I6G94_07690 [Brevibacterium casei]QPR44840.1 hypothetical protein I6G93_05335 [Brevibacterium casei]SMX70639.1 hypothetical protein BC102111_00869 [Brevibacterium casei CIP 102111]